MSRGTPSSIMGDGMPGTNCSSRAAGGAWGFDSVKRLMMAFVVFNAGAWGPVFFAYAILSDQPQWMLVYAAAGAIFGGVILLCHGLLLLSFEASAPDNPFSREILKAPLSPRRVLIGGLIVIFWGVAALLGECL